jgi:hypothetical protein
MVAALRVFHGLICAIFLGCVAYVYYAAYTDTLDVWALVAAGTLLSEGVVLMLNDWRCPMGHLHRRYGDDKSFFELFFPARAARLVIPVVAVVSVIGFGLLAADYASAR